MIELQELRIGNLITGVCQDDEDTRIESVCEVLCIDDIGVTEYSIWVDSKEDIETFDDFKPIPITEEWLKRLGFKYQERDINRKDGMKKKFWISPYFGKHKGFWLEMNIPDEESKDFRCTWLNWDIGGGRNFIHLPTPDSMQYIHQLQNLFFSLTGEELRRYVSRK